MPDATQVAQASLPVEKFKAERLCYCGIFAGRDAYATDASRDTYATDASRDTYATDASRDAYATDAGRDACATDLKTHNPQLPQRKVRSSEYSSGIAQFRFDYWDFPSRWTEE